MPFDVGFGEIIIVLVVALIVFGPGRLPEVGATLGKALRELRRASAEMTTELTQSVAPQLNVESPEKDISCPQCGAANAKSAKFCQQCGNPFSESD